MTPQDFLETVAGVANILLLGCNNMFPGCMKTSFSCLSRFKLLGSFGRPAVHAVSI